LEVALSVQVLCEHLPPTDGRIGLQSKPKRLRHVENNLLNVARNVLANYTAYSGATQVLVAGGIHNFPGQTSNSPYWLPSAELYDPSKDTCSATGTMNGPHAVVATLLQNGQVLIAEETTGELYRTSTGQWTLTAKMYYGQHTGVSTALLPNGDVLIYRNHLPSYASEFYNPFANTWTGTKGQATGAISNGPLALLGTGKVLLAGGSTKYPGGTTNCLLYDPSTNTWLFTGSLKQLAAHTLTRLSNGQVLAVGGADAELYTP
jgi:hypothetical protein